MSREPRQRRSLAPAVGRARRQRPERRSKAKQHGGSHGPLVWSAGCGQLIIEKRGTRSRPAEVVGARRGRRLAGHAVRAHGCRMVNTGRATDPESGARQHAVPPSDQKINRNRLEFQRPTGYILGASDTGLLEILLTCIEWLN